MARDTAAQATRSPRNFGKMMPALVAPAWWPERPMRWSPLATEGGASICTTRSMAPMSMPSSSEDVATSALMRPALSRSSTSLRDSRASEPCRQAAAVDEDQGRLVRADQVQQARVDRRPDRGARWTLCGRAARNGNGGGEPRHVLDRHFNPQVELLLLGGVDHRHRPVAHG